MRVHAIALLILCLALAGCDRKKKVVNSVDVDAPAGNMPGQDSPARGVPAEGTVMCAGALKLPAGSGMLPGDLQVVSPFEELTPDADGRFNICIAQATKPQFVFALDPETTNPVLLGYMDPAAGEALDLSCESTAVGLAFLSPIMMGTTAEQRREFIRAIKAHPDFPLLVAAIEAGFRADPRRLLDPEANPDIYRQAAEISVDVWEGMSAAGKLAFRDQVPAINDDDGEAGNEISFVNPTFVYYVAHIATADQSGANQTRSLPLVTVKPVPQALNLPLLSLPWKIADMIISRSIEPMRADPVQTDYALEDGHFEIYMTKGFVVDFDIYDGSPADLSDSLSDLLNLNSANGRATLTNIAHAVLLMMEIGMEWLPGVGDIAENLNVEGETVISLIEAVFYVIHGDATKDEWFEVIQALTKLVDHQADVINKNPKYNNIKINKKFTENLAKVLKNAAAAIKIITVGGKIINEGVPFVVDLVFSTQEVQYELMHNGARITARRRQDPGDPLSGNEVRERRTFTLPGRERMEMVWIPETGRGGFWLGTHEVTQKQWKAVMGTAPWTRTPHSEPSWTSRYLVTGDPYPAVNISRRDAHEFIGRLNDAAGDSLYRLPTEEEWEYACRAGTRTAWSFGDAEEDLTHFAWYSDNAGETPKIKRVGGKFPNPWGLHDMHGNVLEWVQDKEGSMSVFRGGSFLGGPDDTNSDERLLLGPEDVPGILYITGFRLLRTAEPVARPEPEPVTRVFSLLNGAADMEFVQIEPGSFTMGSPYGEDGRNRDEGPQHRVKISKRFWLGAHEVTQDQWTKVMGTTPWQENGRNRSNVRSNPSHPAVYISWDDAQEFIAKLNRAEGAWWYRLPTEAEWEYACRAGKSFPPTPWSFGADGRRLDSYAWYSRNAGDAGEAYGHAVGTKLPNSWGLHDMHGNVWEWVHDWYDSKYYSRPIIWGASNDPRGPAIGTMRVGRGGSFGSNAASVRSAYRGRTSPDARRAAIGARLVRGDTPGEWPQDVPREEPAAPPDSTVTFPDESQMETFALPGGVEMEFAWIEPGTFPMGAPASEGGHGNERPVHEVEISQGFYLGAHEVTQGQWEAVMGSNPSHYEGDDRPVERVSYDDAHEFIGRLNDAEGDSLYRLPTEAEWEYACRAGSPDPWSHGADEDELGRYAWYSGNNDPSGTKPVGGKWPNRWGLHDMHGNVWEWAQDWFDPDYYGDSPRVDPAGPAAGDGRVVRGGKFSNNAAGVRSAYRGVSAPGDRINTIGFRLLRLEEPAPAPPVEEPVAPEERLWNTTAVLEGHTSEVSSVSFSPDGRTLASGGHDARVRLWDVDSGTQTAVLEGHEGLVWSVSFSPDGRTLASGGWDETVRLWDLDSRTQTDVLEGHEGYVYSVSFSPDGRTLASGGQDNKVRLWDLDSRTQTDVLEGHEGLVSSVSFSPDGRTLASGGSDETIRLWDVDSGTQTAVLGHTAWVNSVSFSPDGRTLASGGWDETVRLWDVDSGTQTAVLGHTAWVNSVSFSPDGRTLASGGWDETVRLWDVDSGTQTAVLEGHEGLVWSVSFSPDGRTLASGSDDRTVRLWDVADMLAEAPPAEEPVAPEEPPRETDPGNGSLDSRLFGIWIEPEEGWAVAFKEDGTCVLEADCKWWIESGQLILAEDLGTFVYDYEVEDNNLTVRWLTISWEEEGDELRETLLRVPLDEEGKSPLETAVLEGHTDGVYSVAFSPDGRTLASGSSDNTVRLWDVDSGTQTAVLEGHTDWVNSVSFSPDGRTLASGGFDKTVRLWDVDSGTQTAVLEGHTGGVESVAFSPDGRTLASGSGDNTVRLWDVNSRTQTAVLEGHTGGVESVAFSPDGRTLASGAYAMVVLWDVDSRTPTAVLEGHTARVESVAFSPDGRTLASGGHDEMVRLWDVDSGTQTAVLDLEDWSSVYSVAFSPTDGRTLATGSGGDAIWLWDVDSRTQTVFLVGHLSNVYSVSFSPDGRMLASGSLDGTVRLWDVAGTGR